MDENQRANAEDRTTIARKRAEFLLRGVNDRWSHVEGVVRGAAAVSLLVGEEDRSYLLAAAYLHDIGYAPAVMATGFHALDGAKYLLRLGEDWRVCCLVAHHSAARYEAHERGLDLELAQFDLEDSPVMDALVFADMTTGATGQPITFERRLADILARYERSGPVHGAVSEAAAVLEACVNRTLSRLAGGRP